MLGVFVRLCVGHLLGDFVADSEYVGFDRHFCQRAPTVVPGDSQVPVGVGAAKGIFDGIWESRHSAVWLSDR